MHYKTIRELSKGLRDKEFSATELSQHFLNRIKKLDPKINSYITVTEELAMNQAGAADKLLQGGNSNLLTGIPLAQKDLFCTKGVKTSCASKMLDNFISPYDATVIEKFNQAGAIMLGKSNMDEFAMGSSNENSYYGAVHNPWDLKTVPGGSSGGAAAIVAAGFAAGATGTDTGGSIRQPAAFCGISGIKPTYGRVSRFGMIAFASSLDQAGPMAKSADDLAIMLNAMAGFDDKDSTSVNKEVPDYTKDLDNKLDNLTIGLPKEYFQDGLHPEINKAIELAISEYKKLGVNFKEISLPNTSYAPSTYYIVAPAEASANLSRFDGVRFGYRCENPISLTDLYERSRAEGFGREVQNRILIGTYVLSAGFYDAYYKKAQQVRNLISRDFMQAFEEVDLILAPTTPTPAFGINEKKDPVSMYLNDIYTIAASLAGLPAMSIPCGLVENKPVGMQLIGKHFNESKLLNVAHKYQQITDWHTKIPTGLEA